MTISITLTGRIPSKKNSKQVICRGKRPMLLPSKAHAEWHALATAQLREQNAPQTKVEKFDLTVQFYAPDLRKTDVSNKLESVNDLLVDFGVIEDDSWFNIQDLHLPPVTLDRENPRAEITIIPLVP